MKRFAFGNPLPTQNGFRTWAEAAIRQIEQFSVDDMETIMLEFTVTTTATVRTLDANTATTADVVNFLGTMLSDIQQGGQKRSYGS